jgi:hypothetical protein
MEELQIIASFASILIITNEILYHLLSSVITKTAETAVKLLDLSKQGIECGIIGVRSLCVGEAMTLHFCGFEDTTVIMKMGRWMPLAFLQYIYTQITHLAEDIYDCKMSTILLPFLITISIESGTALVVNTWCWFHIWLVVLSSFLLKLQLT